MVDQGVRSLNAASTAPPCVGSVCAIRSTRSGQHSSTRCSPFVRESQARLRQGEGTGTASRALRRRDLHLALDAARAARLASPVARPIQTRVAGVFAARVSEPEQPYPASKPRRRTRTGSIHRCDECARKKALCKGGTDAATHAKRCCSTFNLEGGGDRCGI